MIDAKRIRQAGNTRWISMAGLALLIAIAVTPTRPLNAQNSKSRGGGGGGGGVLLLLEVPSTTSATADVTICSDDCTKKSLVCAPLEGSGANVFETCGSGGGWKLYEYTIQVGTTTCTSPAPLAIGGTPAPTCSDATGNAFLSAN